MIIFQVVVLVHILTYIYKDLKKIMKVKELYGKISDIINFLNF